MLNAIPRKTWTTRHYVFTFALKKPKKGLKKESLFHLKTTIWPVKLRVQCAIKADRSDLTMRMFI